MKRWLWMSPAFREEQPDLAALIATCAAECFSKWAVVDEIQDWAARKDQAMRTKSASSCVALVSRIEFEQQAYTGVSHVFARA
eukprot:533355-Heterocapsa_arctica.AAC.1